MRHGVGKMSANAAASALKAVSHSPHAARPRRGRIPYTAAPPGAYTACILMRIDALDHPAYLA